jgi:hypothetical protein
MIDHCEICGYDGRHESFADVATPLQQFPARLRGLVEANPATDMARRPASGGWSCLEYVGHLKDLLAYHRWLTELACDGSDQEVPKPDPDAYVAQAGHRDADVADLLDQVQRRSIRYSQLLRSLDDVQAGRSIRLAGQGLVDVTSIARNARHECEHHYLDLQRLIGASQLRIAGSSDS